MNIKDEAANLWRLWSVRLAALGGLIAAYLVSEPTVLPRMVAAVPQEWRPVASILAGFAAFAIPTIMRRLPQKPKSDV